MTQPTAQLDMFGHVLGAYAATAERPMDNASLYQAVAQRADLDQAAVSRVEPIGEAATPRYVFHRQVRWYQQSLKALGLIERVEGKRGVWQLTDKARRDLHPIRRPLKVIAFSTDLGVAMWSAAEDVFSALEVPITLCFTSPPYPLRVSRAYGNVDARAIVDFVCQALAPIIERWPHLDAATVTQHLLDTADQSSPLFQSNTCGASGTANCGTYYLGQGEADILEALAPAGTLSVPTGSQVDGASMDAWAPASGPPFTSPVARRTH